MKLLIQGDRIVGAATEDYPGPMQTLPMPEGFDINLIGKYKIVDGELVLNREAMVVTPRQARLALLQKGLLSQIDSVIASLPEPERSAAQTEWEYALEVRRTDAWIENLAPALGLTPEETDALFELAATI